MTKRQYAYHIAYLVVSVAVITWSLFNLPAVS